MTHAKTKAGCSSVPLDPLVGRRQADGLRLYAIQKDQALGRKPEEWVIIYWLPPFVFTSKNSATRRLKELRAKALIEYPIRTDRLKFRKYRFVELIELENMPTPNLNSTTPPVA